jgi:hypothetical protein
MTRLIAQTAWMALTLACCLPATAADTNPVAKAAVTARFDFDSFRIIAERNIFDPNRAAPGMTRTRPRDAERRVRTESFALLGTMSYEKGRFAFFDGTSSDYHRVLQPDGSIAGFKVAAVAPTCVRLQSATGQAIELCVGMQMSRRENEDWQVSDHTPASESSTSSDAGGSSGGGGADEVLKRLMQRREQDQGAAPAAASAAAAAEKPAADPANEPDDVVKRLLQKREQELTK